MSIIYQIPHTARFLSPSVQFKADFGNPVPGIYSFDTTANNKKKILTMEANTVYLIERITWAASIPSEEYTAALRSVPPTLALKKSNTEDLIFAMPYSLSNYVNDSPFVAWIKNDVSGVDLLGDISGAINQTAGMVGLASVNLSVSFAIYAINDSQFSAMYRGILSQNVGNQIRGGL